MDLIGHKSYISRSGSLKMQNIPNTLSTLALTRESVRFRLFCLLLRGLLRLALAKIP